MHELSKRLRQHKCTPARTPVRKRWPSSNLPWHVSERLDALWLELQAVSRHLFDHSEALYYIRAYRDH